MVLFLCTGNYYRSRFAEYYFNVQAERLCVPARAFSRGFEAAAARNVGPVSSHTIAYLEQLGIPLPPEWPYPLQLQDADFDRAATVIALDEAEHRPMLLRDFPQRLEQVTFWRCPDVQFADPAQVLPHIRHGVDQLLRKNVQHLM